MIYNHSHIWHRKCSAKERRVIELTITMKQKEEEEVAGDKLHEELHQDIISSRIYCTGLP